MPLLLLASAFALALVSSTPAAASDPEALMKRSGCFKCHAVDREKLGPAYREVAARYRASPDAEQRIFVHLTTNPVIRIDGQEERHMAMPKATEAEVRAVAAWILSR
jgi:cytochrome c